MNVVGLCGFSGSGKTTLAERLIGLLREAGMRVSVVKHAHHAFDIDQPGKDSWRHRQAGAFEVVIASDRRLAKVREFDARADPGVHDLIAELSPCDWVIVEGFKRAELPKLEVWRASTAAPVRYPHDRWVIAVATDDPALLPEPTTLPLLDLNDAAGIVAFLRSDAARFAYRAPPVAAPTPPGATRVPVFAIRGAAGANAETDLADEVAVTIELGGRAVGAMPATPTDLDDLVLGFLLTEGFVDGAADLLAAESVQSDTGIRLVATVAPHRAARREPRPAAPGVSGAAVDAAALARGMAALAAGQGLWRATGANHAAAWISADGELRLVREDVGRRNALDKLLGARARAGADPAEGWVGVTSRVSGEMVTKAAMAGVRVLAAISAPTALAVRLAEKAGIVLIGFARGDSATIYSHAERVRSSPVGPPA